LDVNYNGVETVVKYKTLSIIAQPHGRRKRAPDCWQTCPRRWSSTFKRPLAANQRWRHKSPDEWR